jgi:hypothetical protein
MNNDGGPKPKPPRPFPLWGSLAIPAGLLWGTLLGVVAGMLLGNVFIGAAIGAGLGVDIGFTLFAAAIVIAPRTLRHRARRFVADRVGSGAPPAARNFAGLPRDRLHGAVRQGLQRRRRALAHVRIWRGRG